MAEKNQRPEGEETDRDVDTELLNGRLRRIVDEHNRALLESQNDQAKVTPVALLEPPNYRREYIGRYDRGRRTMFPFDY